MRAATFLSTILAASSATAMKMTVLAEYQVYDWAVTGWSAGCARNGCYYDFNVTGVANETGKPPKPGFTAYCSGQGEGSPYKSCQRLDSEDNDARIVAKLLANNATTNATRQAHIQVSIEHTDLDTASTWWNYTGDAFAPFNQFTAPEYEFTISPDEVYGVAGGI